MRAIVLVAICACSAPHVTFVCGEDADCSGGTCQPSGWCSFDDPSCPSGQRYGEHAGEEQGGTCVGAPPPAADAAPADAPPDGAVDAAPPAPPACEVAQVAAGSGHTCARISDGRLFCWGRSNYGQLGTGTAQSLIPAPVTALPPSASVAAGDDHACAIDDGGAIRCWGNNAGAQLGLDPGVVATAAMPAEVTSWSGVARALTGGRAHTCARHTDGAGDVVSCWGENGAGQLGTGGAGGAAAALVIDPSGAALDDVIEVEAGAVHTCARRASDLHCWGAGMNGRLGNGGTADAATATLVAGVSSPVSLAVGGDHTCAIAGSGQLYCWGRNHNGQVGRNWATIEYLTAASVTLPSPPLEVVAGQEHSCARVADGTVWCWGNDQYYQLGRAASDPARGSRSYEPVRVMLASGGPLAGVAALEAGSNHTCAITVAGTLFCWGINQSGQIGNGQMGVGAAVTPVELCPIDALDDEFDRPETLGRWTLRHIPEGAPPSYSRLEVDGSAPGRLAVEPTAGGWYMATSGFGLYKLVTGDFAVRARVDARNRDNLALPPTGDYNAIGLIARDPASVPPDGDDWVVVNVGRENGFVGSEAKTTANSVSILETLPGAPGGEIVLCRIDVDYRLYRRLDGEGAWTELAVYDRADLPATLQVGIMANSWSPPHDLLGEVDWIRFRRPSSPADCTSD